MMGVSEMQLKPVDGRLWKAGAFTRVSYLWVYASAFRAQKTAISTFTQGCSLLSRMRNLL